MTTYLLLHGAWHDSRVWRQVAPTLTAAGHRVVTPELPGNGSDATPPGEVTLALYRDTIGRLVGSLGEPIVLVGHSMAGIVISSVAEAMPERIKRLVYLGAFLLPAGMSIEAFYAGYADPDMAGAVHALRPAPDGSHSTIDPVAAPALFLNGCSATIATLATAQLRPQPNQPWRDPVAVTDARFGRVPRSYIALLRDRALFPELQRIMCGDLVPTANVVELDTDHSPFHSAPDRLVGHLLGLA